MVTDSQGSREMAVKARSASRALQALRSEDRVAILNRIADSLEQHEQQIMAENAVDVAAAGGTISDSLLQRLVLKPNKIHQLADGIRAIAKQEEPVGRLLSRLEVAEGLVLDKVTSPIGVLLIKGGKEATRSNALLHQLIVDAVAEVAPGVGRDLIGLVTSRHEIDELLKLHDVIDLVIPRGSNQLVSYIQAHTKIPVLGHADGICHIYVDTAADPAKARRVCLDAKVDYPAACNAVEKILVHDSLVGEQLNSLVKALQDAGVTVHGGERAAAALGLPPAPSVRHEYSSLDVTVELVGGLGEAIDHIHTHGSGHTECIVTEDQAAADDFLRRVDSACVFHNASTRFSDGYRFGLGAEVGISTARIHARGPVGVEGLLTTRYLMRGTGQAVEKDKGVQYTFKPLPLS
ncbi:hypothetical protein CHLNCDRAFT_30278 [Chlorella variabilis]|uniref:glutamate-5-semialdehyde dehydrogenase n=1 Tax=Chlorella variabilis TaxID=554065 RepID=E1Z8M1_CHLVA|nr:hypothetical protein CHLNCDRAFT_30278 [Chlorella variabilis]EFN57361.1 hypothetical protein CHLNCDRAFT_30278 [Chlorella variabilis]|eukprot:XP_005849463.1 hypothetical protein CHLNCDRAFT_30278 [Chlorella variabilis]